MSGTTHRCLVTNHRIHAPCGVEIEVEGDRVYVVKVVDGTPSCTGQSFDLAQVPHAESATGYLQICNHCLELLNSYKQQETGSPTAKSDLNVEKSFCSFSEDCTDEELFHFVIENCVATVAEIAMDKVLYAEQKKKTAVAAARELRDWIEVEVDAANEIVTCDAEDYIFGAYCQECAFFEVLQFGKQPPTHCKTTSEKWSDIRMKCLKIFLDALKKRDT